MKIIEKFDERFKIAPVSMKAKDGSMVKVFHRIGPAHAALSMEGLIMMLGLHPKMRRLQLAQEIRQAVHIYREHLEKFYARQPRPLLPMFTFVQEPRDQEFLYIQGFADPRSLALVRGRKRDCMLWCEKVFLKTRPWVPKHGLAVSLSENW